ncbi:prokineticin-2 [Mixophyes fleayi]|uniref:prokineticin-2 n=1 Tax=Mixophyes fleayi TaxID=3061075 RepID=UPI003F4E1363
MRKLPCISLLFGAFLLLESGEAAVITGACEKDLQCGGGMCCAISLWIRSLRICTPLGNEGDECHPISHKTPFFGKRMHHTCPCLPNLVCTKLDDSRYKCLPYVKSDDLYF